MTLLAQGIALHRAGRLDDAFACYVKVLNTQPHHAQALHLMGMICIDREDYSQAVTHILHGLQSQPQLSASHFNLGMAYKGLGQITASIAAFRSSLAISPDDADTHYSLANVLQGQEAIDSYRHAIVLAPDHADAHNNLGVALEGQDMALEAIASYRTALRIRPDHAEAGNNLGGALQDQGEMAASASAYQQAIASAPEFAEARWGLVMCDLPAVCSLQDSIADSRVKFSAALAELDLWLTPGRMGKSIVAGAKQPFYLAYQDENNRDLLSRHGDLCTRLMQRWQQPLTTSTPDTDSRLKVGIASAHIHDHSVWIALVRSWLQHLDPRQFALSVFHLGHQHDAETDYAKTRARYFGDRQNLEEWAETIRTQQPDVLIYPEIGMDAMTLQLACLRLAPLQIAAWGHPETSGLASMDAYFSAQGFETGHAQDHYREQLIALPNLGCCYHALPVDPVAPDLAALGIDEHGPLLLCSGSPFKYGLEHDHIFTKIAWQLKHCQFVFFTHSIPNLTERFRLRLKSVFEDAGLDFNAYCRFVPWQKRNAFYGLMGRAEVMMDTIGFSGFNTAMQAVECTLPIVTREGRFMRGNLASGILKRMGLQELVATSDEGYISITIRLLQDDAYRQEIRDRIRVSRHLLFDDMAPIRAMENFMLNATRH